MSLRLFRHKKVILFDWNRTLVDTSQAFDSAFLHVLRQYTARYDAGDRNRAWSDRAILQKFKSEWKLQKRKRKGNHLRYEDTVIRALRKALNPLPVPTDRHFLSNFHQQVRYRQQKNPQLLPGVKEVVKNLSQTHRLAVLSNSEKIDLKQSGLAEWIKPEYCFNAAKIGTRKPNARIFRHAINKMHASHGECVMVGNSWRTDIRGAQRARIDAVWLNKHARKNGSVRTYGNIHVVVIRNITSLGKLFEDS